MNNNTLGDALKKALDTKKNSFSNYIWKGEKIKDKDEITQKSEKMIDMTPERLKECYAKCEKMLHNTDPEHLGRYKVLEQVDDQINKCNVELLLRFFENAYLHNNRTPTRRHSLWISLREMMANNPEITDWTKVPITLVSNDVPNEFQNVYISDVLEGCLDKLGAFDKRHLTMTFITKMGLWFTKQEENELKGNSNVERLRSAKERLRLPDKLPLRISEKGLSFHEMRAILVLPKKQKYSDMTTEQLVTLRDKVLLRFQREVDGHIFSWKRLQRQLLQVAASKNIEIA